MISKAQHIGRLAARRSPEEAELLKETNLAKIKKTQEGEKIRLEHQFHINTKEEQRTLTEMQNEGTPHERKVKISKYWGYSHCIICISCVLLEFKVTAYTIEPLFQMEAIYIYIIAGVITILIVESVSKYIHSVSENKANKKEAMKKTLLQIYIACFISVILLIGIGSYLRKDLALTHMNLNRGIDEFITEDILLQDEKNIDLFKEKSAPLYLIYQLLLGLTGGLLGGAAFYEASHRLLASSMHMNQHKKLRKLSDEKKSLQQAMELNWRMVEEWLAAFQTAYVAEKDRIETGSDESGQKSPTEFLSKTGDFMLYFFSSPLLVMLIAAIIFIVCVNLF